MQVNVVPYRILIPAFISVNSIVSVFFGSLTCTVVSLNSLPASSVSTKMLLIVFSEVLNFSLGGCCLLFLLKVLSVTCISVLVAFGAPKSPSQVKASTSSKPFCGSYLTSFSGAYFCTVGFVESYISCCTSPMRIISCLVFSIRVPYFSRLGGSSSCWWSLKVFIFPTLLETSRDKMSSWGVSSISPVASGTCTIDSDNFFVLVSTNYLFWRNIRAGNYSP